MRGGNGKFLRGLAVIRMMGGDRISPLKQNKSRASLDENKLLSISGQSGKTHEEVPFMSGTGPTRSS